MKKTILLLLTCILYANPSEIDTLKAENKMLKQKIKELEQKNNFNQDDIFIDFNRVEKQHQKAMQEINKIMEEQLKNQERLLENNDFFTATQKTSSFYRSGEIVSTIKQDFSVKNNEGQQNSFKLKTYNIKTKQELKIKDIINNMQEFEAFFEKNIQKNKENKVLMSNFYLDNRGFVFCSDDLKTIQKISYKDMKPYLKDDFIKALWY